MTAFELPEGFILLPLNGRKDEYTRSQRYGLSSKGEIFNVQTGETLTAPEGSDEIEVRVESPGHQYAAEFHIPTLLMRYFPTENSVSVVNDRDPIFDHVLTDVTFTYRNFRGLEGPYNPKGNRSFAVIISDEQAKELEEGGWTVREVESKKGDRVKFVKVSFPIGFNVSNIKLDGEAFTSYADLNPLDLEEYKIMTGTIRLFGRHWEMPERTNKGGEVIFEARKGVKVYIVSMDVTTKV